MEQKYIFKAVIFDLDGVITKTALLHSKAWKTTFDKYLKQRGLLQIVENENYTEVTPEDYLKYIDGRPRYEGVRNFLESRNIHIPYGDTSDSTNVESICGVGNSKNENFNKILEKESIQIYESTVNLIYQLKACGIKIAVASSSKNCKKVLERAGLWEYFDVRIDGNTLAERGLKGKPDPAIFLEAANELACLPYHCVIIEDAVVGVEAGKKGNFGLVLGLAREDNEQALLANGADVAVKDIAFFPIEKIDEWFKTTVVKDNWNITYHDYQHTKERFRETLLSVGNGYFCTRGALEYANHNVVNYPATYIAGVYNTLPTSLAGKDVYNEDMVNVPNFLPFTFNINNGEWFDVNATEIMCIKRNLDLSKGLYVCKLHVRDKQGNETLIKSERFVAMDNPHKAMMRYSLTPLNYSASITLKSGIDCSVKNEGVERYKQLSNQHIIVKEIKEEQGLLCTLISTNESNIEIAEVIKQNYYLKNNSYSTNVERQIDNHKIFEKAKFDISKNETISLEKTISIYTSKHDDSENILKSAMQEVLKNDSFENALKQSETAWKKIWDLCDIKIENDRLTQKLLRLNFYHVLISMSPNNKHLDASIGARGLHGEAYRGHIFWDEVFVLPLYARLFPNVAKSMLMYRYRRLNEAKKYARQFGYKGAMYPWQSASKGDEQTQIIHLNPLSGKWDADNSSLQRHVSLAIAYNIWTYFQITQDISFMQEAGGEILLEICRFWESKCVLNPDTEKYDIAEVMGPDEFHEKYPDAKNGGLINNAYTNLMTAWLFTNVLQFVEHLQNKYDYLKQVDFSIEEIENWQKIAKNLKLNISKDGVIEQFDGYFSLKELNWELYKSQYSDFHRLDRILKAEGLSPDQYKVSKQADLLMVFYLLDEAEVTILLENMGYVVPDNYLANNFEYYYPRTSHGSTLSRVVHAKVAGMIGKTDLACQLYKDALISDYEDIQGGTTGEGIHAGVMVATVEMAMDKNFINTIKQGLC